MKANQEQFKLELVLRESKAKRKLSADYRQRDRSKERHFTPSTGSHKLKQTISFDREKSGCLNTIFHKERESREFSQKCMSLLQKKKGKQNDEKELRASNNFNTMLQNIKNVIKQNERKEREIKVDPEPLYNNEFQCIRSTIHQIYQNQDKIELYRMIRNSESKNGHRRESAKSEKLQKTDAPFSQSKLAVNPFLNLNTILCFTMPLNDHQQRRQSVVEVSNGRVIASAGKTRAIQINRPVLQKSMNFNLSGDSDGQYSKKLKNLFDFLYKVNYSNNIYVSLQLNKSEDTINTSKYKIYIGKGNNSLLIKSLMKRRFWWEVADSMETNGINFCWSQNIIDKIQNSQQKVGKVSHSISNLQKKRRDHDENDDLNRKILSADKSRKVQSLITKQGFIIPFEETFVPDIITNHLPRNYCIGSKKNLFKSLFHYFSEVKHQNPFEYIPKTYHIKSTEDQSYTNFIKQNQKDPSKVWIVKPGENSNRGRGIKLSTFKNINQLIRKSKHENGQSMTYIIQSYINHPFLYNNRKFDIRHYMMITSINGLIKAYWYKEGYIRTSSEVFDLEDLGNQFIHLTNDAIQKNSEDYEKYEPGNKVSYSQFQRYLDYTFPSKNYNFEKEILPKMKEMASYIIKANYQTIDHRRHQNNFQIFGLDFMIDRDFRPWLIEVNYNPCLEVNCPVLERVIPSMVESSFRLALDPLFPPTAHFPASKRFYLSDNYLKNLKFQLVFDEGSSPNPINSNYEFVDEKQEEEEYQDEGQEVKELIV